ncbi:hypothetical protein ACFL1S_02885 [Pseudomonadota bacterium]
MLNAVRSSCCRFILPVLTVLAATLGFTNTPASAQFIKQIDPDGNITYHYSKDEPSEENRRINEEQLRHLREFVEYRKNLPAAKRRAPQMTVRTGAAVCNKRISLLKLKTHGCE